MINQPKIGFVGAGNMAEAIARGIVKSGLVPAADVFAMDPSDARREIFSSFGVTTAADVSVLGKCDVIVLAVKPQVMFDALKPLAESMEAGKLVITIAAGIKTASLAEVLPEDTRIVRVMPNTPMLCGKGMSGVCKGPAATDEDMEFVLKLCAAAGVSSEVTEEMMDAVTAVSGSGPAYFFLLTELLEKAALKVGLSAELAEVFSRQTFIGSAALLEQSPDSAAELRRKVTSPKGTTEAAINSMLGAGMEDVIVRAVEAARDRGIELSAGK